MYIYVYISYHKFLYFNITFLLILDNLFLYFIFYIFFMHETLIQLNS